MNLQEQLNKVKAVKAAKQLEITNLLTKALDEEATPDEAVEETILTLEEEVATLEKNVARISKLIEDSKQVEDTAEEVSKDKSMNKGSRATVASNLPKGMIFTKAIRAKALSKVEAKNSNYVSALDIAKSRNEPEEVLNFIKAGSIGSTTDAAFGSVLTDPTIAQNEFVELLRDRTVLDKISSQMKRVDFNQKYLSQLTGAKAEFVEEGAVKPTVNPTFGSVQIGEHKLASIVMVTDEMLRNQSPNSDARILEDLIKGTAETIDEVFLGNAVETAKQPQGVLNGVTGITGSGRTVEDFLADIAKLRGQFISNKLGTSGLVYIMSENMVDELAELRSPLGVLYFEGLQADPENMRIGSIKVIATNAVEDKIIAVKPSELLLADDGQVKVDYTDQATVNGVSLWENNLSAVRVERFITWAKARPVCTGFIDYSTVV